MRIAPVRPAIPSGGRKSQSRRRTRHYPEPRSLGSRCQPQRTGVTGCYGSARRTPQDHSPTRVASSHSGGRTSYRSGCSQERVARRGQTSATTSCQRTSHSTGSQWPSTRPACMETILRRGSTFSERYASPASASARWTRWTACSMVSIYALRAPRSA